jgi:hypothetical protein
LNFFFDTLYSEARREFNRLDLALIGRNGTLIPTDHAGRRNNVVTSATIRQRAVVPRSPAVRRAGRLLGIQSRHALAVERLGSHGPQPEQEPQLFFRESPTILVNTPLNQGITANFDNTGGDFVNIVPSADVNDPNSAGPGLAAARERGQ